MSEAQRELEEVPRSLWAHPEVLSIRWQLAAERSEWNSALQIAREQVETCPDLPAGWVHQSYALHEQNQTREAYEKLLTVAGQFRQDGTIAYNLACYTCRLGRLEEARNWLKRAKRIIGTDKVLAMAMEDPDLEALRP